MPHLLLPWSRIHTPGISAQPIDTDTHTADPVVHVTPDSAAELAAAFLAYCGSWQQADRHGCQLVAPLLAKHGVTPPSL